MHPNAALRQLERNDLSTLLGYIVRAKTILRRDHEGVLRFTGLPIGEEIELLRDGLRATRPAAAAEHLNRHREDAA
jgi:hypothetical protein